MSASGGRKVEINSLWFSLILVCAFGVVYCNTSRLVFEGNGDGRSVFFVRHTTLGVLSSSDVIVGNMSVTFAGANLETDSY